MFSVICTEKYIKQVIQAVGAGDVIFKKTVKEDDDIKKAFEEASRIFSSILILDAGAACSGTYFIEGLKSFRIARPDTRVIVIAPCRKPGDPLVAQIVKLGIYDIIAPEGDENGEALLLPYIVEALDKTAVYSDAARWDVEVPEEQNQANRKVKVIEKVVEKTVQKTIKQQVLAFYTTDNNLDKDDVLTQIACLLAKKSKQKILVIDMNTMTPNLDHFFGIGKEIPVVDLYNIQEANTGLKAVYDSIEKKIFAADLLEELAIRHRKFENLFILTGLYDLNLFETVKIKHLEELIDRAVEVYDTVLINTHPDISIDATYFALKRATGIIAVTNANYTNARNLYMMMKYLTDYHKIYKDKIKIIVNNLSRYSLDFDTVSKIFEDYEILGCLPFNPAREAFLNRQGSPFITSRAASRDVTNYVEIIEKLGYIPKMNTFQRIFKRKRMVSEICTDDEIP